MQEYISRNIDKELIAWKDDSQTVYIIRVSLTDTQTVITKKLSLR